MKKIIRLLAILLLLLMTACVRPTPGSLLAEQTLVHFYEHLSTGRYVEADALYGGDYAALESFNPALDPEDHAALWQNGCRLNGLQCLPVRSSTLTGLHDDVYMFLVEFSNPDGSLFVRGPCCGATETEMPSKSQFLFSVIDMRDGTYRVLDLPLFIP